MLVKLKPRLIKQKKRQTKQIKQLKKLKIMQKKLKKQINLAIQKQLTLRQTKQRLPLTTLNKLQTVYQMTVKMVLVAQAAQEMILILMVNRAATPITIVIQRAVLILAAILAIVLILMMIPVIAQTMIMMIQMMMKINLTIRQLKTCLQTKKIFQVCQVKGNKDKNQETQLLMKLLNN